MKRICTYLTVVTLAVGLASCRPKIDSDWEKAQKEGTEQAYKGFIAQHQEGPHAKEARERLAEFEARRKQDLLSQEVADLVRKTAAVWFFFFGTGSSDWEAFVKTNEDLLNRSSIAEFVEVHTDPKVDARARDDYIMLDTTTVLADGPTRTMIAFHKGSYKTQPILALEREVSELKLTAPLENIEGSPGYRLGEEWDTPVGVTGSELPDVRFRKGSVILDGSEIQFSSGIEVAVNGRIKYSGDESPVIARSEEQRLYFVFRENAWTSLDG